MSKGSDIIDNAFFAIYKTEKYILYKGLSTIEILTGVILTEDKLRWYGFKIKSCFLGTITEPTLKSRNLFLSKK